MNYKQLRGSVVAPLGFRAEGVFCDIKRIGTGKGSNMGPKPDLALLVSDQPATVAGLFTTNQICAAPVKVCIPRVAKGVARAVVVNSGNANACTGRQGVIDARDMARLTGAQLNVPASQVLVASTGRIGVALPMTQVRAGIVNAASRLGATAGHAGRAAHAIMTSDTRRKQIAVALTLGGRTVRIGGICKGAGMIQPGMSPDGRRPASLPRELHATMLAFLTTDAAIETGALQASLTEAVAGTFNGITVDGDMSTNDTALIMANGMAGNRPITNASWKGRSRDFQRFQEALHHVCAVLARMMVEDGEGVHRVVTVRVQGARNQSDADAAARSVANSSLVKTSWHGGDPNWGRIIDALGYSAAKVVENKVDIGYSARGVQKVLWSLKGGQPTAASFKALCKAATKPTFDLHIHLNLGRGRAVIQAADLTEAYVDFNKGDVGDPASLGG